MIDIADQRPLEHDGMDDERTGPREGFERLDGDSRIERRQTLATIGHYVAVRTIDDVVSMPCRSADHLPDERGVEPVVGVEKQEPASCC